MIPNATASPQLPADRFQPFPMPRLTAPMATLVGLQQKFSPLMIGAERWHITLASGDGRGACPLIAATGVWLGHRVNLHFPEALLHRTLLISTPDLSPVSIPDKLFSAVAASAIGAWLTTLPHHLSLKIDSVQRVARIPPGGGKDTKITEATPTGTGARRLCLAAQRHFPDGDNISYPIAIDFDAALIDALPDIFPEPTYQWPQAPARLLNLPITLQCEIGRETFPCSALATLHPGDILFFSPYGATSSIPPAIVAIRLRHRNCTLMRANIQPHDQMVITQIDMNYQKSYLSHNDNDSDHANPPPGSFFIDPDGRDEIPQDDIYAGDEYNDETMTAAMPGDQTADHLAQLPLHVIFDVGTCEMRLADLQKLDIGHVLPVAQGTLELVRVTVNGHVIGRGELIDVDGKVGVLLTRLN